MTKKPGRPPKYPTGAMTTVLRVRIPIKQMAWLDAQPGNKSQALRRLLDEAMEEQRDERTSQTPQA